MNHRSHFWNYNFHNCNYIAFGYFLHKNQIAGYYLTIANVYKAHFK